ncbi:DUF6193 family natural product biosynthesis protein [Streptomyces sp. CA-111067]|uniref:DUF6193 family natural product biosynthesis protein n=1 Tax=Streptomyces sp. CA-111067 TaxID=3240046 RepID=UPI003D965837
MTPEPADFYLDVAAHGSLAAAVQSAAAEHGLSVTLTATPSDPLRHATAESVLPHRKPLVVAASEVARRWSVMGDTTHGLIVSGVTEELSAIPAVVRAWADGAGLDEIARAAPFPLLTGRQEVPDGNTAEVNASEWQFMRQHARDAGWPEFQSLVEAAYAEPELRALFPFTEYWVLFFSSSWEEEFYPRQICLEPPSDLNAHRFTLRKTWSGPPVAQPATATEAAALAARICSGLD